MLSEIRAMVQAHRDAAILEDSRSEAVHSGDDLNSHGHQGGTTVVLNLRDTGSDNDMSVKSTSNGIVAH